MIFVNFLATIAIIYMACGSVCFLRPFATNLKPLDFLYFGNEYAFSDTNGAEMMTVKKAAETGKTMECTLQRNSSFVIKSYVSGDKYYKVVRQEGSDKSITLDDNEATYTWHEPALAEQGNYGSKMQGCFNDDGRPLYAPGKAYSSNYEKLDNFKKVPCKEMENTNFKLPPDYTFIDYPNFLCGLIKSGRIK